MANSSRRLSLLKYKERIFNLVAFLLFTLGALKLLNRVVNRLRYNRNEDGRLEFPFVKTRRSGNLQILVYHRVNDDKDPFFAGTPVNVFKAQMEYLASNFNIISLEEAVERLRKRDVPDNTIVVTFDDGYRDNYVNAFPILKKLSIPATIFLAVDAIGSCRVLWHDRVFSAFRETRVNLIKGFGRSSHEYPLNTVEEKLLAQEKVLNFIRSQNERELMSAIDLLVEKLEVLDRKEVAGLMLSWEEVRAMHLSGISFGSHTVTHPILSKLSRERTREEIEKSKHIIDERLGARVKTFAYPNGKATDFNETTKKLLRDAGFICALTTSFGTNECGQDLFELRRATPWDKDVCAFGLRLNYYKFCS
jgi:peptidoglycan/xylan/chitin deacetylase (PgdA/CDA1 family)